MKRSSSSHQGSSPKSANVAEVKAHFSRFLRQVVAGEEITITSHNHPVARIVRAGEADDVLRTRMPTEDPSTLATLMDQQPVCRRRVGSLALLLQDRRKR